MSVRCTRTAQERRLLLVLSVRLLARSNEQSFALRSQDFLVVRVVVREVVRKLSGEQQHHGDERSKDTDERDTRNDFHVRQRDNGEKTEDKKILLEKTKTRYKTSFDTEQKKMKRDVDTLKQWIKKRARCSIWWTIKEIRKKYECVGNLKHVICNIMVCCICSPVICPPHCRARHFNEMRLSDCVQPNVVKYCSYSTCGVHREILGQ